MKAYFSAALVHKDKYLDEYRKIVEVLKKEGHEVLEDTIATPLEKALAMSDEEKTRNYSSMLGWINKADFAVFEASFPSTLHIGHEISLNLEKNKPVIVLYHTGAEPVVLKGLKDERIIWVEYRDIEDLDVGLKDALYEVKEHLNVRFSFFVSPKILNYLDEIVKEKQIPRSVFIRGLIEKDMVERKRGL